MAWQLAACGACAAGETARVPCRAQSIAMSSIVLAGLGNPKARSSMQATFLGAGWQPVAANQHRVYHTTCTDY